MNIIQLMLVLFLSLVLIPDCKLFCLDEGIDHYGVSKGHDDSAQKFVETYLMDGGEFSAYKIQHFIERLEKEATNIKSDLFETAIIEKIELDIVSYKKASKNGKKKSDVTQAPILIGYHQYLIPKMKKLLEFVLEGRAKKECQGLVDDFVRGYISYYVPNAHRSIWPRDLDLGHNVKHLFKRYHFKKNDKRYIEANNLIVPAELQKKISECLGDAFSIGDYLPLDKLEGLKKCNIDISELNPGVSALWKFPRESKTIFKLNKNYFPEDKDKIYFDRVIFRGHSSPKLKVFYIKDKKKIKIKLKMGQEVHTDIAVSKLMELVGLNQDKMLYKKKVKVYLDDTPYEEFKSLYVNKYGLEKFIRFITAHGREDDVDWIILEDVLFETRQNNELRVGPIDITSWDLGNRREYRSLLLLWGWLGLNNIKLANFKFLFKQTENGLRPLHRMHDAGSALGAPISLRKPKYVLSLIQYEKVNAFSEHFLSTDKHKHKLKLNWNDFSQYKRYFKDTTWSDLKWMARKIAALSSEDICQSLLISGMPLSVIDIYRIKLLKRRNEIVSAFSLEEEFPLVPLPDLKTYTPKEAPLAGEIKNGKVKKRVFSGKNDVVHVQETWLTFLQKIMAYDVSIRKWKEKKTGYEFSGALEGLEGLKVDIGVRDVPSPTAITTLPIGVGVQAVLSRKVEPNTQVMNNGSKMHLYKIIDRIKLKFDLESPLFKKIVDKVDQLDAHAGVRFYEYEIHYVHYHDYQKEAYLSSFRLPKMISNLKKFAAYELEPLEYIKTYHRLGFEFDIGAGVYSIKPIVRNEVGVTAGIKKELSNYILRDQYGQLHVFSDQLRTVFGGVNFGLVDIDLFIARMPLLRISKAGSWFHNKQSDIFFELPTHHREKSSIALEQSRRDQEYLALINLEKEGFKEGASSFVKRHYDIEAKGKITQRAFGGVFLINKEKHKALSEVKVSLENGEQRQFYRHGVVRHKSIGLGSTSLPLFDILVSKRKRISSIIEIDQEKSDDFSFIIRTEDYYRLQKKAKLEQLIADLNRRFSVSPELSFYREYLLPEKEELNKYRKIYALTRTFIDGEVFTERIRQTPVKTLLAKGKKHFWDDQFSFQQKQVRAPTFFQKSYLSYRLHKLKKAVQGVKRCVDDTKKQCAVAELSRKYHKLIKALHVETYGVHFLRRLLSEEGLFVMGDIAGVLVGFSALQDLQQQQRRRFAGKSWGLYSTKPPLQRFLRYNRVVAPLVHIDKTISDRYLFGELETALPPNLDSLFAHETVF